MQVHIRIRSILGAVIALVASSMPAAAQFPGDLFFDQPVRVAAPGDQIDVDVLAFVGTESFGGARFEIGGDLGDLEILGAAGIHTLRERRSVWLRHRPDEVAVTSIERGQGGAAQGTVVVATLHITVRGSIGDIVGLTLLPREVVTAGGTTPWTPTGFALAVQIVDPSMLSIPRLAHPSRPVTALPPELILQGVPVIRLGATLDVPWLGRRLATRSPWVASD